MNDELTEQDKAEIEEAKAWSEGLRKMAERIRKHFARHSPFERAVSYLKGLLGRAERKNGWQLAESAGDETPYGMQNLLDRAIWSEQGVVDDLQEYIQEHLGDPDSVLALDETGFVKKGDKSAGVQRQYSGTAGKVENCQIGVFLAYASPKGHALIDAELYLPESWTDDPDRCVEAGIPEEIPFRTKGEMGRNMVERALANGMEASWVTGDEVYGRSPDLIRFLEEKCVSYVLAVAKNTHLGNKPVCGLSVTSWQTLSAGQGAKGPRLYDWARIRIDREDSGFEHWALLRRSLEDPEDIAYYRVYCPMGTRLEKLVEVAGKRWSIETCFEQAKGEVGLNEYEVRKWHGWYRHMILAMMAFAFLTVTRIKALEKKRGEGHKQTDDLQEGQVESAPGTPQIGLLPFTVPEVRRLLVWLVWDNEPPKPVHVLHWSRWRRKHQQIAKYCHYKARSALNQFNSQL